MRAVKNKIKGNAFMCERSVTHSESMLAVTVFEFLSRTELSL